MTTRIEKIGFAVALGGALVATPSGRASADEGDNPLQEYGLSLTAGGGVAGFTEEAMRDTADTAGVWNVRAAFGTRFPVALEAAYLGSAQNIDAIGLDSSAVLLGTALEADARVNIIPDGAVQPYAFVGAAWRRYNLTNADVNTSSVEDQDDILEIPMGAGVAYRYQNFLGDVRGEFRATTQEDLLPESGTSDEFVPMHTWGASLRLGYEF